MVAWASCLAGLAWALLRARVVLRLRLAWWGAWVVCARGVVVRCVFVWAGGSWVRLAVSVGWRVFFVCLCLCSWRGFSVGLCPGVWCCCDICAVTCFFRRGEFLGCCEE